MASFWATLCVPLPANHPAPDEKMDSFKRIQPILDRYCLPCHGETKQKGDFRLDQLGIDFKIGKHAESWHDVLDKLNRGEMPPEDQKQLSLSEFKQVTNWLQAGLKRASDQKRSTGGQVVLRRLSRYEYQNTLRDLLKFDDNFSEDLPPDPASEEGFQNNGDTLGMSSLQIELYLQSARRALAKAIVTGPKPTIYRHRTEKSIKVKKMATGNRLTHDSIFAVRLLEYPREGSVMVRVEAAAVIPEGAGYPRLKVSCGMKSDVLTAEEELGAVDVRASIDQPQVYRFKARIERFPLPGHNPKFPGVIITLRNDYPQNKNLKTEKRGKTKPQDSSTSETAFPLIVIKSVEFEGPFIETWPPKHHTNILLPRADLDDDLSYAKRVLARFVTRAFRRPASEQEVARLLAFFAEMREQSLTFEEAMRETLILVLVSPEFLYLIEPKQQNSIREPLTPHELATRLSYFLWSSMPDKQLFDLAEKGNLKDQAVLQKQVFSMISDPKSRSFVENFTDQWFDLSALNRVAVNPEYYPDFDNDLKNLMRLETHRFFGELLHNNLSALNLIDSDFAILNRRLANHYGLVGPLGNEFERIDLTNTSEQSHQKNQQRGGLLTQGSILLSNSTGENSHPIRRAVWLLDRILDSPPSPPPPDVPELNAKQAKLGKLTVREQLEFHRSKKACNQCHRGIDPWGIAFEHYDGVGKWRNEIHHATGKKARRTSPVDAMTVLPGGDQINGLQQLKQYLLKHERDRFARSVVKRLLAYALGRSLEITDNATVETLCLQFKKNNYRLADLMTEIVNTDAFQFK